MKNRFLSKNASTPLATTLPTLITTLFSLLLIFATLFFGEHITNNFHDIWQLVTGNADRYQSVAQCFNRWCVTRLVAQT
jgi:iron complex transport system permease protein